MISIRKFIKKLIVKQTTFVTVKRFPVVTTSRCYFAHFIHYFCTECDINDEKREEWMKKLNNDFGSYLAGTIFVESLSPYLLLHELIHHISAYVRGLTQSKKWIKIDHINDGLDNFLESIKLKHYFLGFLVSCLIRW